MSLQDKVSAKTLILYNHALTESPKLYNQVSQSFMVSILSTYVYDPSSDPTSVCMKSSQLFTSFTFLHQTAFVPGHESCFEHQVSGYIQHQVPLLTAAARQKFEAQVVNDLQYVLVQ
jgi:hypothetical protein